MLSGPSSPALASQLLAQAAGHLLTWPAVSMVQAPARAPPVQLSMPAQEADKQGDKGTLGEMTVSLSDSTVPQAVGGRVKPPHS